MNTTINQLLLEKGREVVTIAPGATVTEAVKLMHDKNVGALVILNTKGKLAGLFAERDAIQRVLLPGKQAHEVKIQNVMQKKVVYATGGNTVDECMAMMTRHRVRHLPVLDDAQKVVGIISIGDLVKHSSAAKDVLIRSLQNYIEGSL